MATNSIDIWKMKIARIKEGQPPRVIDLFAGAGGLSLGFDAAGFEISAAVEWDKMAAKTHSLNYIKSADENNHSIP